MQANVTLAGSTAICNTTGGSGSYQFRIDAEPSWSFSNTRSNLNTGTHILYVRDLFQNECQTSVQFTLGSLNDSWQLAEVISSSATPGSIILQVKNANPGARVRVDYSKENADLNDASGKFWKIGADVAYANGGDQTITLGNLETNTMYYFRLLVYGDGKKESGWKFGGGARTQPQSGMNLVATVLRGSTSGTSASLDWDPTSYGHTAYELQVSVSGGAFYTLDANIAPSATNYTHTNLATNTAYRYQIRAKTDFLTAPYSNQLSLNTGSAGLNAPSLIASIQSSGVYIQITDSNPSVQGYELERKIGTNNFARAAIVQSKTYTDAITVDPDVDYTYRVRALSLSGGSPSAYSSAVTVRKISNPGGGGVVKAYWQTDAQLQAGGYEPSRFFPTGRNWDRTVSPFLHNHWNNKIGLIAGKPNVIDFGYGTVNGLYTESGGNDGTDNKLIQYVAKKYRAQEISQVGTAMAIASGSIGVVEDKFPGGTPVGHGQTFKTDQGDVTVNLGDPSYHGFYNWIDVDVNRVGSGNPNYSMIRWDLEHAEFSNRPYWLATRNAIAGGKMRHKDNGGSNPEYMNMSDEAWYQKMLDAATKIGVTMYKRQKQTSDEPGLPAWLTTYGQYGTPSAIWDRVVTIDGQQQPTLRQLNNIDHTGDMVFGHFAHRIGYASAADNMKYAGLDHARVPMKNEMVTGIPTYYRIMQVNDINSQVPKIRVRLEDEQGRLCRNKDGVPYKLQVTYKAGSNLAYEDVVILRSEGDQNPDLTFDLTATPDPAWWKVFGYSWDNMIDWSIAHVLKRSYIDKSPDGKYVMNQIYPYVVQQCCVMFGICGNGGGAAGQCEANATGAIPSHGFVSFWAFRQAERVKTITWQADDGSNKATVGPEKDYKVPYGDNAKINSFQALNRFGEFVDLFPAADNYFSVPLDISYDGGSTWVSHNTYQNTLTNYDVTPKAAVKISWNATQGKGLIAGTPLYTKSINVKIRYTIPGRGQVTKDLSLSKDLEDQFYFERIQ